VQGNFVSSVKAFPSVYEGDLVLLGDNVTLIERRFDINGSMIKDNGRQLQLNLNINNP
jgi:hypothetical protein